MCFREEKPIQARTVNLVGQKKPQQNDVRWVATVVFINHQLRITRTIWNSKGTYTHFQVHTCFWSFHRAASNSSCIVTKEARSERVFWFYIFRIGRHRYSCVCVCAPAMNNCYVPFKMSFNGPKQLPMKSWQSLPLPHIYAIVVKSISHLGWFNSYKRSTCVLVPIFRKRDSGQILWNVCGPLKLNTSFRMFLIYI